MAFIDRNPKPGAHCKDYKSRMYDKYLCDRSDECRWKEQGYEEHGALKKCSGIKIEIEKERPIKPERMDHLQII